MPSIVHSSPCLHANGPPESPLIHSLNYNVFNRNAMLVLRLLTKSDSIWPVEANKNK